MLFDIMVEPIEIFFERFSILLKVSHTPLLDQRQPAVLSAS